VKKLWKINSERFAFFTISQMSGLSWTHQDKNEKELVRDRRMSIDWHEAQDVTHLSRGKRRYAVLSSAVFEPTARQLENTHPDRFRYFHTHWRKFSDGTDNVSERVGSLIFWR
jgi:hypothetical protein